MDIVTAFVGFVEKYGAEILNVASSLDSILAGSVLPKTEAQNIQDVITKLETSAANITDFLQNGSVVPVTINESDIKAAVVAALPDVLKSLGYNGPIPAAPADPTPAPTVTVAAPSTATVTENNSNAQASTVTPASPSPAPSGGVSS